MINLENKKIIITGAASGIGRAIVLACVRRGATVFALDINQTALADMQAQFSGGEVKTFTVDVSDAKQISQIFDTFQKDNISFDGLVNNAGVYLGKSLLDYNDEEINRVIAINIKSAIFLSKEFAQRKMSNKEYGSIINMSSVSGEEGSSDAIYGLSKAALIGLTKSNAMNFSPYIRVNAIAPGIVETAMTKNIPKQRLQSYKEHELIKDPIKPEDVANTAVFLLSDIAKNYTGVVFDINNGCYLR
jgi:3-oxoacyl-[acyl-carrier protein] reductase